MRTSHCTFKHFQEWRYHASFDLICLSITKFIFQIETRGCSILLLDLARQLGLQDCGQISDMDSLLLRLMTPVAKFYTAKSAVATVSEGLECFGGQGYIEDTGLPGLLRDVQVGCTNIYPCTIIYSIHPFSGSAYLGGNFLCDVPGCSQGHTQD